MQLLCNGVVLDLLSGTTLSFKKVNPLFAFDSLTCERTQSFDIPDTATNERVLRLAKLPAFDGYGMRRRFDAELQEGLTVKRGYLYVDSYEKGKYKAIFVTGELVGLQRIKNLGKLADITTNDEVVTYGAAPITPTDGLAYIWANVNHKRKGGTIHPSSLVKAVSERVVQQNGLRPVTLPDEADGLRIIPAAAALLGEEPVTLETAADPSQYSTTGSGGVVYDSNVISVREGRAVDMFFDYYTQDTVDYSASIETPRRGRVVTARAKIDIVVKFPDDFPDTVYLAKSVEGGSGYFLGGYSFTIEFGTGRIIRTGTPLAGREVLIERDTTFTCVHEMDRTIAADSDYYGWYFVHSLEFHLTVRAAADTASVGDFVRLQDNLPDVTYIELLKSVAAITGKVLNYTDAEGVTFDDVNVDEWQSVDVTGKALDMGEVSRKFGDYAQHNTVKFDGGEHTTTSVVVDYAVDNDNIEREKALQVVPFSNGFVFYVDGEIVLYIDALDGEDDKDTIGDTGASDYLLPCWLVKNQGVQNLCDASTSLSLDVYMTLGEYEAIGAKTLILFRGTRYVWTEANWSKNTAKLKLSKILA